MISIIKGVSPDHFPRVLFVVSVGLQLRKVEVVGVLVGEVTSRTVTVDHLLEGLYPLLCIGVAPDKEGNAETRGDLSQGTAEHLRFSGVPLADGDGAVRVQVKSLLAMQSQEEPSLAVPASQHSVELGHVHQVPHLPGVSAVQSLSSPNFGHHEDDDVLLESLCLGRAALMRVVVIMKTGQYFIAEDDGVSEYNYF